MSDAEDSDAIAERMEEALDEEVALGFLNQNNQGCGACHQAVRVELERSPIECVKQIPVTDRNR